MARKRTLLVLVCGVIALTVPSTAAAATITVTTAADVVANDGKCSLREAINSANTDTPSGSAPGECPAGTPGANTIVLGNEDYVLTLGQLSVTSPVTLEGHAQTIIDADGLSRVLSVSPGASLTVDHMILTGGRAPDGASFTPTTPGVLGGGGGAIDSAGALTLGDVTLTRNHAGNGGSGTTAQPAGNGGSGGAVENTGPALTITDSTISSNTAGSGGASNGDGGAGAGGSGGGIDVIGSTVSITGSTINNNHAGDGGTNQLVGGPGGNGGGLSLSNPVSATLANDTIVANSGGAEATPGPAGPLSDGGALFQTGGTVTVTQVTISGNTENDAFNHGHNISTTGGMTISDSALDATCSSGVTDGGHNFALGHGGCPGAQTNVQQQQGSPAFDLRPLGANGGPTATMLPGPNSALIDAVPAKGARCLPTDQRGVKRPQGRACDAGAVERRPTVVQPRPQRLTFGRAKVGRERHRKVVLVFVSGETSLAVGKAKLTGRDARDFQILRDRCLQLFFMPGESCRIVVAFTPRQPRRLVAELKVPIQGLGMLTIRLSGRGYP